MELTHVFCILSLAACSISVLNHLRYDELCKKYEFHYDHLSRHRRDVRAGDDINRKVSKRITNVTFPHNKKSLFMNIDELKGFIKKEVEQTIDTLMEPVLQKKLNNWQTEMKCNCVGSSRGPRGPKGEKGERGPRGERGKRGPSIHPPELKQQNLIITANKSDDTVFSCQFRGNPLPTVTWNSSSTKQEVTELMDRENSLVTSELKVSDIQWNDRGNVTCHASNILGKATGSGYLTVHAKPIISLPDGLVVATLGSVVDFPECKVISEPRAVISWTRGVLPFPRTRTSRKGGVLKITNAQVQDEGYYACTAKNYLGTAEKYLQLHVKHLQFSKESPSRIFRSNDRLNLSCGVYGSEKQLSGRWTMVSTGGQEEVLNHTSTYKNNELVITTEARTSGLYKCEISDRVSNIKTISEVKMFKINSTIMNPSEENMLGQWLDLDLSGEYRLCWRMSEHGNSTDTFFNNCGNRLNTITVFKSKAGKIWGGFTDVPWKRYTEYEVPEKGSWTTSCGGDVNSLGIDYPPNGNYPDFARCNWTISRDVPFTLRFLRFATETCCDHLIVGGKKLSGQKIPSEISSSGNSLTLHFRSDYDTSYSGFKVLVVPDEFIYSSRSFMFSNEHGNMKKIQIREKKKAICSGYNYGPCFGSRDLAYMRSGTSSLRKGPSKESTVKLEDVEVFYAVKN